MKVKDPENKMDVIESSLNSSKILEAYSFEKTTGLMHWIRKKLYGECPRCQSTHLEGVNGWRKMTCKRCGNMWSYDI